MCESGGTATATSTCSSCSIHSTLATPSISRFEPSTSRPPAHRSTCRSPTQSATSNAPGSPAPSNGRRSSTAVACTNVTEPADPSAATALNWLAKAADDRTIAELVLDSDVGIEWAACFHAQQAAEKAVKTVLVHLGVDFPKSPPPRRTKLTARAAVL
ncbi:MAG: HEPN domain-containing protein [Ilumatobacter sp.]|uniref:HEPN domain-containing protein n=1 Tax=Ilumatobacter sp. TaxID=1967498 RepID=UPI00391D891D